MVAKSGENGCVAPFLQKCYDMVSDPSTDSVISWTHQGHTFLISDITQFSLTLLPNYFKHNNFSSFIRQLNIYGFRKIDTDRWEFANDNFVKGQKHLLINIRRRKHPHAADHQKPDNSDEAPANDGLWKEVENLKSNKNSLMQELVKLRQHQESAENKLLLLTDRLQGMEKHQQQMLSFLVMVVQSPGFMVQLLQPNENNWRMAELGDGNGMIVKYKPPVPENLKPVVPRSPTFEKQPEPELSFDGLKDLCISSEFLKVLMDEKLSPLENHPPFLLPDLPDDGSWEQLFLGSPFLQNTDEADKPTVSGMEIEPITPEDQTEKSQSFESLILEMEKTEETDALELRADGVHLEGSEKLKSLTKQMELLASETDNEEEEEEEGRN
ncbi:heat stress transcription factor A-8 [Arachis duranensis]|uniref:Heat stress transcription factor A-8 n=1 Tax=Arachis duranensis TaxID=130453 RepID=A0A6P4CTU4_ARADU|nr:heat stress transcription factor A-8 [Arachis duranensis]